MKEYRIRQDLRDTIIKFYTTILPMDQAEDVVNGLRALPEIQNIFIGKKAEEPERVNTFTGKKAEEPKQDNTFIGKKAGGEK